MSLCAQAAPKYINFVTLLGWLFMAGIMMVKGLMFFASTLPAAVPGVLLTVADAPSIAPYGDAVLGYSAGALTQCLQNEEHGGVAPTLPQTPPAINPVDPAVDLDTHYAEICDDQHGGHGPGTHVVLAAPAALALAWAVCAAFACTWWVWYTLRARCDEADAAAAARALKVEALCASLRAAVSRGVPVRAKHAGPGTVGVGYVGVDSVGADFVNVDSAGGGGADDARANGSSAKVDGVGSETLESADRLVFSLGNVGGLGVDIGAQVAPGASYVSQLLFGAARWCSAPATTK